MVKYGGLGVIFRLSVLKLNKNISRLVGGIDVQRKNLKNLIQFP